MSSRVTWFTEFQASQGYIIRLLCTNKQEISEIFFFYLGFFEIADNFAEFEKVFFFKKRPYQKQRTTNLLVLVFGEADCKFPLLSFKFNYVTVFGRLHFLVKICSLTLWKDDRYHVKILETLAYSAYSTQEAV